MAWLRCSRDKSVSLTRIAGFCMAGTGCRVTLKIAQRQNRYRTETIDIGSRTRGRASPLPKTIDSLPGWPDPPSNLSKDYWKQEQRAFPLGKEGRREVLLCHKSRLILCHCECRDQNCGFPRRYKPFSNEKHPCQPVFLIRSLACSQCGFQPVFKISG